MSEDEIRRLAYEAALRERMRRLAVRQLYIEQVIAEADAVVQEACAPRSPAVLELERLWSL